ncbi:MAG: hypothetical protein HRT74_13120, partial [Flavobacteriales bacterium]|nr:hypothetical protein [Flavobacteriales bacterium]
MKKQSFILFALLLLAITAHSQYYWVGGSGNWSDATNHWATSSGGNSFHATPPSQTDDVFIDNNSFSENGQSITIDQEAYCRNLTCTNTINGGIVSAPGISHNVHGNIELAEGSSYGLSFLILYGTSNHSFTTNGTTPTSDGGTISFNGTGTYTLNGNLSTGEIRLLSGTFNTDGYDIDCSTRFSFNGNDGKHLILGNSTLTTSDYRYYTSQGINLTAGTSTIVCSQFNGTEDLMLTYYNLVFTNESIGFKGGGYFNSVDISATQSGYIEFTSGADYYIDEIIGGQGTRNSSYSFRSDVEGEEATIHTSSGEVSLEYVEIRDVHATGGATFTINNAIDLGNNTGWNLIDLVPMTLYWVNNGGDWEDASHWSDTSGGLPNVNIYPSKFDDAVFDENSMSMVAQTVVVNQPVDMASLDMADI